MLWLEFLVKQGKLDIMQPTGLDEWKNDERSKITLNDLMQMQSGLRWNEDYGNRSDVTLMLSFVKAIWVILHWIVWWLILQALHWYYSSGASNIVSYLIRKKSS